MRKFYTKHQDIIELFKGYLGCLFFIIDGINGWPVIDWMGRLMGI